MLAKCRQAEEKFGISVQVRPAESIEICGVCVSKWDIFFIENLVPPQASSSFAYHLLCTLNG